MWLTIPGEASHIGIHVGASLDTMCEKCPAVWSLTEAISVRALGRGDKQEVKGVSPHHGEHFK